MGKPLLYVNALDLSEYLVVRSEEGFDPSPVVADPQFTGAAAFQEGERFVQDAVKPREWVIPLILDPGGDRAVLHRLITQINNNLFRGAKVQFAVDGTLDPISYFDLERGRLDTEFNYYHEVYGLGRAVLHLWTRPFANTGTARTVASLGFPTQSAVQLGVTGILGDINAAARIEVQVGSQVASAGRVIAYGVHPHPSFHGIKGPTDWAAMPSAQLAGASGAVASIYHALPLPQSGATVALTDFLTPPDAHIGRHRVLAIARSRFTAGIVLWGRNRDGQRIGPTSVASSGLPWDLIDLGEITVEPRTLGQEGIATQLVDIVAQASGTISASPAFHVNALVYLPLDIAPGGLFTRPASAGASSYQALPREFFRFEAHPEKRAFQGNASVFVADRSWEFRGRMPELPPLGSPMATGPAQLVVLAGVVNDFIGNGLMSVRVDATERFRFLR